LGGSNVRIPLKGASDLFLSNTHDLYHFHRIPIGYLLLVECSISYYGSSTELLSFVISLYKNPRINYILC